MDRALCGGRHQRLRVAPDGPAGGAPVGHSRCPRRPVPEEATAALGGVRARLRLPLAHPPSRRAEVRPDRLLALERADRPLGRHGRRAVLRGPVGAPAACRRPGRRVPVRGRRRMAPRPAHRRSRGVLLVRDPDHLLPRQRGRGIALGARRLAPRRRRPHRLGAAPARSGPFLAAAMAMGILYIIFMLSCDIPMYISRWRADEARGRAYLALGQGLRDAWSRRVVTFSWEEWRAEIPWMTLYFSVCVWWSLALVHSPRPGPDPVPDRPAPGSLGSSRAVVLDAPERRAARAPASSPGRVGHTGEVPVASPAGILRPGKSTAPRPEGRLRSDDADASSGLPLAFEAARPSVLLSPSARKRVPHEGITSLVILVVLPIIP